MLLVFPQHIDGLKLYYFLVSSISLHFDYIPIPYLLTIPFVSLFIFIFLSSLLSFIYLLPCILGFNLLFSLTLLTKIISVCLSKCLFIELFLKHQRTYGRELNLLLAFSWDLFPASKIIVT